MLALPRAFSAVGIIPGVLVFFGVCLLTHASGSIILQHAERVRACSYRTCIDREFGRKGGRLLSSAILVHVSGVMVIYLIIIGDVLVGSAPSYNGVIPTVLGVHASIPWYLSRPSTVFFVMLFFIAPMLIPRTLSTVSRFSKLSVVMVLTLATSLVMLACIALAKGLAASDVSLYPPTDATALDTAASFLREVSVACLAFTCQFNLLPIKQSMKNPEQMQSKVLVFGITLCGVIYTCVALAGYTLFGSTVEGDVLKDLTVSNVSRIIPVHIAHLLIDTVGMAYCGNLCVNFVLKVWALRDSVMELAFHMDSSSLPHHQYYALTASLVLTAFLVSIVIPSVYFVIAITGATACVVFSYGFPAALELKKETGVWKRTRGYFMLLLGFCMATMAVFKRTEG